jgi:hypothetical protein
MDRVSSIRLGFSLVILPVIGSSLPHLLQSDRVMLAMQTLAPALFVCISGERRSVIHALS